MLSTSKLVLSCVFLLTIIHRTCSSSYKSDNIKITQPTGIRGSLQDQKNLRAYLLNDYSNTIRPIQDQDKALKVGVSFFFGYIHDYDEVKGVFSFNGKVNLNWTDASLQWTPQNFSNVTITRLPIEEVWIPNIGIGNAAENEEFMEIDQVGLTIAVDYTGRINFLIAGMIKVTCSSDVTYFPFDVHLCRVTLTAIGYEKKEVQLTINDKPTSSKYFDENGEWRISMEDVVTKKKHLDIFLKIRRRSSFLVVNIFLPIMLLLILNCSVFLIPVESGERISFSITGFLAFAVYITILTEKVPHQSNPLSLLSAVLGFQLANSSLMLFCNIMSVNMFYRTSQTIPQCFSFLVRLSCCKNETKISSMRKVNLRDMHRCSVVTVDFVDNEIWRKASKGFDRLCFIIFVLSTVLPNIVFIFIAS